MCTTGRTHSVSPGETTSVIPEAQAAPVENPYAIPDLNLFLPPPNLNFEAPVSPVTPKYLATSSFLNLKFPNFLAVSGNAGSIGEPMDDVSESECFKDHQIEELGRNTVSCAQEECQFCDSETGCGPAEICPLNNGNKITGYVLCPQMVGTCYRFSVTDTPGAQEAIDKLRHQSQ
ncbi:hypothetical protein MMC07_005634 [Pseudocyphellaria aurata]|nr:hypothetical protein [Pseudocyphellaria aurata]